MIAPSLQRRGASEGFTLLEMVIVMFIVALLLSAIYSIAQGTLVLADEIGRTQRRESRQQAFVGFCEHLFADLPATSAVNLRTTQDGGQYISTLELGNVPSPFDGTPNCLVSLFTEPVLGGGLRLRLSCRKPTDSAQDVGVSLFDDVAQCEWRAFDRTTRQWTTVWNEPIAQKDQNIMTYTHPVLMELSLIQAGIPHHHVFWITPTEAVLK